jgi:cytidylate kinase
MTELVQEARVVAIDGAAGSGKSTLARGLAIALDLPYVNTGLMYRALTLEALARGVDPGDEPGLVRVMQSLTFDLDDAAPPELLIEGSPPSDELASTRVENAVSEVARHPHIRGLMRQEQRRLGGGGAVMEGRDIATVVFPDAGMKLYLVADPAIRAARRARERDEAGDAAPLADALHERDAKDMRVNPFRASAGALQLDTSTLDVPQTIEAALALIHAHAPELLP